MHWIGRLLLALLACTPIGCTGHQGPTEWTIPAGQYAAHFDAARDALRDYQFDLARVDARAGILSSIPAPASGLASPWRVHGISTPRQATESFMHRERRRATVTFEPAGDDAAIVEDLRTWAGDIRARVIVTVDRVYRDGRQVDSTSIQDTSFYRDPRDELDRESRAAAPDVRRDDPLAAAIVARAMKRAGNAPEEEPPSGGR